MTNKQPNLTLTTVHFRENRKFNEEIRIVHRNPYQNNKNNQKKNNTNDITAITNNSYNNLI